MKQFKTIITLLIIATLFFLYQCDHLKDAEVFSSQDCADCYYPEPDSADLILNLTINDDFKEVFLTIYKGNIDDEEIIFEDYVDEEKFYFYVKTDELYSAKGKYEKGKEIINAYDGSKLMTIVGNECDEQCWFIRGGRLDLTIE